MQLVETEITPIQRIFSNILINQFWMLKHFLKINNRVRNIYWSALSAARANGENFILHAHWSAQMQFHASRNKAWLVGIYSRQCWKEMTRNEVANVSHSVSVSYFFLELQHIYFLNFAALHYRVFWMGTSNDFKFDIFHLNFT